MKEKLQIKITPFTPADWRRWAAFLKFVKSGAVSVFYSTDGSWTATHRKRTFRAYIKNGARVAEIDSGRRIARDIEPC